MSHRIARIWKAPGLAIAAAAAMTLSGGALAESPRADYEEKGAVSELAGICPQVTFRVNGRLVLTHAGTEWEDGTCQELDNGRRVEVDGTLRADGALIAHEVELE